MTIAANFLNGSAPVIAPETIWNFWAATSINIDSQFGGSILAPSALLSNSQNIEGGVFVGTLHQSGEIHEQAYTGSYPTPSPVPLPGSLGLMFSGLVMLGAIGRRKAANGRKAGDIAPA